MKSKTRGSLSLLLLYVYTAWTGRSICISNNAAVSDGLIGGVLWICRRRAEEGTRDGQDGWSPIRNLNPKYKSTVLTRRSVIFIKQPPWAILFGGWGAVVLRYADAVFCVLMRATIVIAHVIFSPRCQYISNTSLCCFACFETAPDRTGPPQQHVLSAPLVGVRVYRQYTLFL